MTTSLRSSHSLLVLSWSTCPEAAQQLLDLLSHSFYSCKASYDAHIETVWNGTWSAGKCRGCKAMGGVLITPKLHLNLWL